MKFIMVLKKKKKLPQVVGPTAVFHTETLKIIFSFLQF